MFALDRFRAYLAESKQGPSSTLRILKPPPKALPQPKETRRMRTPESLGVEIVEQAQRIQQLMGSPDIGLLESERARAIDLLDCFFVAVDISFRLPG